jgi:hypothetical protein
MYFRYSIEYKALPQNPLSLQNLCDFLLDTAAIFFVSLQTQRTLRRREVEFAFAGY